MAQTLDVFRIIPNGVRWMAKRKTWKWPKRSSKPSLQNYP